MLSSQKTIHRLFYKPILYIIYVIGGMLFLFFFGIHLLSMNGDKMGPLVFPVLAVFFGFSALMYNRARALDAGVERRRSLYAAERGLQATIIYIIGIMLAAGLHGFFIILGDQPSMPNGNWEKQRHVIFFLPIMIVAYSWISFYLSLRVIAHRHFRWQYKRDILRRLR